MVVEEKVSPFAQSPLMVSQALLAVREGPGHDTPLVGVKILPGSLVRVGGSEHMSTKEKLMTKPVHETRMHIELDGDQEPLGWVTGVSKDEIDNLKLAARGFPLMRVVKSLPLREGKEADSSKVGEIHKDTAVRIMQREITEDGVEKALVSLDGNVAVPKGWVNWLLPGKDKDSADVVSMVPKEQLVITFDLRVHTANSLMRVLAEKKKTVTTDVGKRRKGETSELPSQVAGKRPKFGDTDGPSVSRHTLVETPASLKMVFNCFNAPFAVKSWTGKEHPFDKLPLEQAFDLLVRSTRKRMGRVKLAYTLNTPFLERVEFPNDWFLAEEYGVSNDGWQSAASLELEIVWGKEVAVVEVQPWLAYASSIGARIMLRKLGAASGQCATVQRVLQDDRIVARVDGYSKDDGVKGEVILDLQPANVILTTFPHYPRDTKLLLLHQRQVVDASVLHWVGGTVEDEGSRHMINVKPLEAKTGAQVWHDLNQFNHVAAPEGVTSVTFEEHRISYCGWVTGNEDKVEDAITGNLLLIKDQLIFLEIADLPGLLMPPQYVHMHNIPDLVKAQMEQSPKRSEGTHTAQPVLVRAGPGTGKTWAIKQALFLLAEALGDEKRAGEGVRLTPVIVFVQRVVRLLREHGDDPQELLSDPNGLMRWYISNEFIDRHEDRNMLLIAHELGSLVVLVDGVDEAAGMREIVEAFVHYELVVSGNRLMVTSRPEGVDIDDYRSRFVVVNLKELSQEQQRTVIQMQLQGNRFFEHLVNIAECRKALDTKYKTAFKQEVLRLEIEEAKFGSIELQRADDLLVEAAQEIRAQQQQAREAADEDEPITKGKGIADDAELKAKLRWVEFREVAVLIRKEGPSRPSRKTMVDSQIELQSYLEAAETDLLKDLRSPYMHRLNTKMMTPSKVDGGMPILELLEMEIRPLPSPCSRAHIAPVVEILRTAMRTGVSSEELLETLALLALQRKLPASGAGRRGARSVPIVASGLWYEVVKTTEDRYLAFDAVLPQLMCAQRQQPRRCACRPALPIPTRLCLTLAWCNAIAGT